MTTVVNLLNQQNNAVHIIIHVNYKCAFCENYNLACHQVILVAMEQCVLLSIYIL
jgi:hypothetical protein